MTPLTGTIVFRDVDTLTTALRAAAEAHHKYETSTGKPDANWADWYARYLEVFYKTR